MKIFLSTPFSHKIDPATGYVVTEFRTYIEGLLQKLRDQGHEVFAAVEHEG